MRRLRVTWAVASCCIVLLLSGAALLAYFFVNDRFSGARLPSGWYDLAQGLRAISGLASVAVGALILLRRPANRVSLLLSFGAIAWALEAVAQNYGYFGLFARGYLVVFERRVVPPAPELAFWLGAWMNVMVASGIVLLLLVFPDGRLPSRRWRPVAALIAVVLAAWGLRATFGPGTEATLHRFEVSQLDFLAYGLSVFGRVFEIVPALYFVTLGLAAMSLLIRYRTADQEQRQQLRWFAVAAGLLALASVAVPVLHFAGVLTHSADVALHVATRVTTILLPVAIGFAIFKYRLFDIDIVINKAVVFGVLSLFITVGYVSLTVGVGGLVGAGRADSLLSVLALGLVAVGFEPVRGTTQRLADRLVYGDRAAPREVLAGFSRQLPTILSVDQALPAIAEAMANGIRARGTRVHLYLDSGEDRMVSWPAELDPPSPEMDLMEPIVFRGQTIGRLEALKRRGESVTREDRRVVGLLSKQSAAFLNNVKLTMQLEERRQRLVESAAQLHASRRRLVTAQIEVRRSVEAELRRRVAPLLKPIADLLARAEEMAMRDSAQAVDALEQAAATSDDALAALRDIAHGLHSPLLEERGIVVALESQIWKMNAAVRVRSPVELRSKRFDPRVEATVYMCCIETARHQSSSLEITLVEEGCELQFSISGHSFDPMVDLDKSDRSRLADRLEAADGRFDITYPSGGDGVVVGRLPATERR
jgi:hypothetical protein